MGVIIISSPCGRMPPSQILSVGYVISILGNKEFLNELVFVVWGIYTEIERKSFFPGKCKSYNFTSFVVFLGMSVNPGRWWRTYPNGFSFEG